MYSLARLADTDVQAEAATVIANVTSARSEVQLSVCRDGALHLLLYLCASEVQLVQAAATRAIANLTQAIDNEPAIREARAAEQLYSLYHSGSADVKWQAKRALANLEASRILIGLRRYGGAEAPLVDAGEVGDVCKHADAANVGAQREVARALANIAASSANHDKLMAEGAFALLLNLVVSNSAEVQQQATRALANLALADDYGWDFHAAMADEGALDLLVLLAASWDEGVQQEAAIAICNFAHQAHNRTAVIRAGALPPLIEQLGSTNVGVRYHAAQALLSLA